MAKSKPTPPPVAKKGPTLVKPTPPTPTSPPPKFPYPDNALAKFEAALLALFGKPTITQQVRNDISQVAVSASQWERDAWIRILTNLTKGR